MFVTLAMANALPLFTGAKAAVLRDQIECDSALGYLPVFKNNVVSILHVGSGDEDTGWVYGDLLVGNEPGARGWVMAVCT